MLLTDYLIDHSSFDWSILLCEWTWLLPPSFTAWLMNRFGDLFIVLEDETVHMLDVGTGTLRKIAENRADFAEMLDDAENANNWLMIPLIDQLIARGLMLGEGQCYSYKQPPVLGGNYELENIFVLSIQEHYGAYGSIHRQLKDLPDGAQVVIKLKK
jgi:hypothetical protein